MPSEIHIWLPDGEEPLQFESAVRLGRTPECHITIDDEFVSGEHLEFRPTDSGWVVEDLGSRNGTFVDGERVRIVELAHQTRVRLGHPGGVEVRVMVPGLPASDQTRVVPSPVLVDRYIGRSAPKDMSERTRVLRAALHDHEQQQTRRWLQRTRHLRIAVAVLLVVAIGAAGFAFWQASQTLTP